MAKSDDKSEGGKRGLRQSAKLGDIYTAAKSSMEPADYERGYPPNENELLNKNFSTGKRSK